MVRRQVSHKGLVRPAHLFVELNRKGMPGVFALLSECGWRQFSVRGIPWCDIPWYDQGMKVDKISISFEAEFGDRVRAAAVNTGKGLSFWLAEAAAAKLRSEALAEFLDSWEREHSPLTASELGRAESELGLRRREGSH